MNAGNCSKCGRNAQSRNRLGVCARCMAPDPITFDPPMSSRDFEDPNGVPLVFSDLETNPERLDL